MRAPVMLACPGIVSDGLPRRRGIRDVGGAGAIVQRLTPGAVFPDKRA